MVENEQSSAQKMMSIIADSKPARYQVAKADDLKSAFDFLSNELFDIILLNLDLPDSGGFYTLSKIQSCSKLAPVVVVNGAEDEHMAVKALNEGASDYLSKGEIGAQTLLRTIRYAYERAKGFKQIYFAREDLRHVKLGAIKQATENAVGDIQPSLETVYEQIQELKHELVGDKTSAKIDQLVSSANASTVTMKSVLADLSDLVKEIASYESDTNPLEMKMKRVLVVEDEAQVSEVIVKRLKRLGCENIDTASNGQEGYNKCLESFKEGQLYNAIISDWKMPKMSGYDFLKKIRDNPFMKHLPFMIISAVDDRNEIKDIAKLKVSQYLLKPFTKEEFDKRFRRLLYYTYQ